MEGPKGTAGWQTTNATKEKSCLTMRSSLGQGKMWLAQDFFSMSLGVEQAKRRIRDELCRFSVITNPPKTAFQESKKTYSGKVAGMQDDIAVVMQIAMEATIQFYSVRGLCTHCLLRAILHVRLCAARRPTSTGACLFSNSFVA